MIEEGAASGLLRTCKFYPPHGTTNSEFGAPMDSFLGSDVFRAMEQCDIVLNIYGESMPLRAPITSVSTATLNPYFIARRCPACSKRILD